MTYYISLGANLGNREQTLHEAVQRIEQQVGPVLRCSDLYYSAPWGFESENGFCNLCCCMESALAPIEVLHRTQLIEQSLGRIRKSVDGQYADRTIDIDLIRVFDGQTEQQVSTPELTLPHPLWQEREFVKVPLAQIMQ